MNNLKFDGIIKEFVIEPKKQYAREYYMKNKSKKTKYYNDYYQDNKIDIINKISKNKYKLPQYFTRDYKKVILKFN